MAEEVKIVIDADDNASKVIADVKDETEGLNTTLINLSAGMDVLGGVFETVTGILGGIAETAWGFVEAAAESETVTFRMEAQLKALGKAAPVTADEINDLATELSQIGGFDDEALVQGQTTLLRFGNLSKEQFREASFAAANLAALTGVDLATAFQQVAMALDAPENGLGRLKRQIGDLTDEQKAQISVALEQGNVMAAQEVILDALTQKTQGAARAMGETLAGNMNKLQTIMGNLQENIGGAVLPAITGAIETLIPYLEQAGDALAVMLGDPAVQAQIRTFGEWLASQFVPLLKDFVMWLGTEGPGMAKAFSEWFTADFMPAAQQAGEFTQNTLVPAIRALGDILGPIGSVIGPAVTLFLQGWAAQMQIINPILQGINNQVQAWKDTIASLSELGFVEWLGRVADGFSALAQKILGLVLPDWLTPGSPTPLEIGIRGITDALGGMTPATAAMGGNFAALPATAAPGPAIGGGVTVVYSPTFSAASAQEFQTKLVPLIDQQLNANQRRRVERR